MERQTLEAYNRTELKKGASNRLRRQGWIPAVIYGSHEPKTVSVPQNEFEKKFHSVSENTIITLKLGKEKHDVLVKDYQEDTIRGFITHIDFYEIEKGKVLRTNIPVHVNGTPAGVKEGGLLEERLHEIEVECVPADIPEYFELDIAVLQVGDALHVSDLPDLEGVKVLNSEEQTIALVAMTREEVEEEVEEEELEGEEGLEEGEAAEESEEAEE